MRRLVYVFVALLAMSSARAEALTIRDVVELTRAGLGDDVLLALIEVDPSVFPIDTETLKYLKESGVSQRVIVGWSGAPGHRRHPLRRSRSSPG